MLEKYLFLFTTFILFIGCKSRNPEIRILCERDKVGNYVIKWEMDPPMDGMMKLYVSDNPEVFNKSRPVGFYNIHDYVTKYITSDNVSRKYFMLTFNDKYSQIVGPRNITMDRVVNLRDVGGYMNNQDKMIRWGKVYRSGELDDLSTIDSLRLDNLGIKTIIDLRTEDEVFAYPSHYTNANFIHIPISLGDFRNIESRIQEGRVRKGDGILYMQDLYLQYITNSSEQFSKALDVFLDKDNYPVLFTCSLGKDRAGFLAAMILACLDVPEEVILNDYVLSNNYLNDFTRLSKVSSLAENLSRDAQETMTVLLSANETFLDLALRKIKKDYGSLDKYLTKELNMTEKKRQQLKEIMLL